MKVTRIVKTEQDVKYLKASLGVRYWINCEYSQDNGETWINGNTLSDTDEESERIMNLTPCVVKKNIGYRENNYLELIIDLENGKVLNWPEGFCLNTNYKVCDDGEYSFLDFDMNEIVNITKEYKQYYVPDFLAIEDDGYGDYVCININGDGTIQNFDKMKNKIQNYFNDINNND
jgi:hypothetical protein